MLSKNEVLSQSRSAFGQWEKIWKEHAKVNGELMKQFGTSQKDIVGDGNGRNLVICAMGQSVEQHIETLKEYQDKVDVMCVDKAFIHLVNAGIKVKYVVIADAGIDYNKWVNPVIDKTEGVTLISNITGNPEWAKNWKGKVIFYLNKDNIGSEKVFGPISGCTEVIPASSNVGNTCIVFASQILGYDKYLLVGYDYCWFDDSKYYAFDDGGDKRYFMKHINIIDVNGRAGYTSNNLMFSCKWLQDYYNGVCRQVKINVYNCSEGGILTVIPIRKFKNMLELCETREVTEEEKKKTLLAKSQLVTIRDNKALEEIMKTKNIIEMQVRFLDMEVAV